MQSIPVRPTALTTQLEKVVAIPSVITQTPPVIQIQRKGLAQWGWIAIASVMSVVLGLGWYIGLPLFRAQRNIQAMAASSSPQITIPTILPSASPTRRALFVAATSLPVTQTPLVPTLTSTPTITPLPSDTPTIAPVNGMTVLLLGIDARAGEGMRARSDALIVARLDPQQHVISLLSLPRDLWVTIPGGHEGKVNSAFFVGEANQTGQGPSVARQTVSNALGIPIDHHVVVDFRGFGGLIDAMGGVEVDVPTELYDSKFPTEDYGYTVAHFVPGRQHMSGAQALMFSRIRHPDSDFQRMRRQQLVLLAIAQTLQARGILATLHQADDLTAALRPFVHTDLAPDQVLQMLWSIRETDPADVRRLVVDASYLREMTIGGAYALVADDAVLRQFGARLLADPSP